MDKEQGYGILYMGTGIAWNNWGVTESALQKRNLVRITSARHSCLDLTGNGLIRAEPTLTYYIFDGAEMGAGNLGASAAGGWAEIPFAPR